MLNVCRFCLSQDEISTHRIGEVSNPWLTAKTVLLFTGIRIDTDRCTTYAMCLQCANTLKKCVAFRKSCIYNNYVFQQLYQTIRASSNHGSVNPVKDAYDINADSLQVEFVVPEKATEELITYDDVASIEQHGDEVEEQACTYDTIVTEEILEDDEVSWQSLTEPATEMHEERYSANYIELGEPHSEDDELDLLQIDCPVNRVKLSKSNDSDNNPARDDARRTVKKRNCKHKSSLCHMCGTTVFNLNSHIARHTAEQNNTCPYCSIKMTHASNLTRHIQAIHLKTAVKTCSVCDIGFTHYSTYRSHLYREHGIGTIHECHECSRQFVDACMLRKHNKRYHNHQQFHCETCGKIFKMREQLKRHQTVHTDEQPYQCRQCPKRFKTTKSRHAHEIIHEGILYQCMICKKSFRFKYLVNSHIRKMHPDVNNEMETSNARFTEVVN